MILYTRVLTTNSLVRGRNLTQKQRYLKKETRKGHEEVSKNFRYFFLSPHEKRNLQQIDSKFQD